jgi:hypothetical protein
MIAYLLQHPELVVLALQAMILLGMWALKQSFASKGDVTAAVAASRSEIDTQMSAQAKEMKSIGAATAKTAGDLSLLEQTIKGLPSSDDISEIRLSIVELEGEFKAISANVGNMDKHIGSISRSVDRIEDWLMNGKGKTA